jgi:hypothetical protein
MQNRDDNPGIHVPPPLLYIAVLGLGMLVSVWYPVLLLESGRIPAGRRRRAWSGVGNTDPVEGRNDSQAR